MLQDWCFILVNQLNLHTNLSLTDSSVNRMSLDFAFIAAQTSLFDIPDRPFSVPLPSTLLQDITQLLAHEAGVEQWSEWLVSL